MKRNPFHLFLPVVALLALISCQNRPVTVLSTNRHQLETSARSATVRTTSGSVAGYIEDGVYTFKGIPYAKAERFQSAVDPDPWEGVRSSRAYGPTCPQGKRAGWYDDNQAFAMHWDDGFPDEDCLRVNVWTAGIGDGRKRAVMVWLHGGGFSAGSGQEQIGYDGANLARGHDVVVVTLNHRLNVLGFLDLSGFGAKYAASGNLGMTDIVKALEWVRDNIAAFGGDPANVTIFGQSGGGGKVSTLLAMPSARGLFTKAIVESGSILEALPQKYSRRIGAATVRELGINPSRIDAIGEVPYETLLAAYDRAVATVRAEAEQDGALPENLLNQLIFGTRPVVDGNILPAQPGAPASLAVSKDIPLIVGTTYHEFTRDTEDPIFKPLAIQQASDRTAAGCAPVYLYQFTWESPVLDGVFGSTHCIEIPFVFDNVALHRTFTGGGADAVELGHRVSRLWTNFAKTGVPSADGIPEWEPYPRTMILNIESTLQ
ncbi:MAG: carboxylesterase/lipase family protein [Bacteroidales bacterium]|nr:carboxylesterase/lipase family protein [Bacteroidales bacterium]